MIFPNAYRSFEHRSAAPHFISCSSGEISLWHAGYWSDPNGDMDLTGMGEIQVCTASNDIIENRMARGDDSFDVIGEYTTSIFFMGSSNFRLGWGLGRLICRGWTLRDTPARTLAAAYSCRDTLRLSPLLLVDASPHHVWATK